MKLLVKLLLSITLLLSTTYASEDIPTKEEVAKLYVATFNRAPDAGGLNYWMNEVTSKSWTLNNIAQSFFDQIETKELYPDGTLTRDFIRSVYANLFNREPDTLGWNYWEGELNRGAFSRNSFIIAVINGAQDSADGMDKTILNNKNEVGLYFANAGFGNEDSPTEVMSGITADSDTVTYMKDAINNGYINASIWDSYISVVSSFTYKNDYLTNNTNSSYLINNIVQSVSGTLIIEGHSVQLSMEQNFAEGYFFYDMGVYGSERIAIPNGYFPLTIGSMQQINIPSSLSTDTFGQSVGTVNVVTTIYTSIGNKTYNTVIEVY